MMKKKLIAALLAATVAAGTMPSAGALLDGFTASRTYSNQQAGGGGSNVGCRRMPGTTIRSKPRMSWG